MNTEDRIPCNRNSNTRKKRCNFHSEIFENFIEWKVTNQSVSRMRVQNFRWKKTEKKLFGKLRKKRVYRYRFFFSKFTQPNMLDLYFYWDSGWNSLEEPYSPFCVYAGERKKVNFRKMMCRWGRWMSQMPSNQKPKSRAVQYNYVGSAPIRLMHIKWWIFRIFVHFDVFLSFLFPFWSKSLCNWLIPLNGPRMCVCAVQVQLSRCMPSRTIQPAKIWSFFFPFLKFKLKWSLLLSSEQLSNEQWACMCEMRFM